jgi:hypothetical protein
MDKATFSERDICTKFAEARGWQVVAIFTLGTVLMRSAGCAINDFADRDFDKHVQRTAQRVCIAAMGPTSRVSWTPENELRCLPGDRSQGGAL